MKEEVVEEVISEATPEVRFAKRRESYFRKLAAIRDKVLVRPTGWPRRPAISDENRKLCNLVVADVLAKRFKRVMKEQNLDVDDFAKHLHDVAGNDYWFSPEYRRDYHADGSYTPRPRCRLKEFIEGELPLPPENELRLLECALDYEPNQVLTNHYFENDGRILDFLLACGYLDENYRETGRLRRSKRVKAYFRKKEDEERQKQQTLEEYQKQQAEEKKNRRENFISRLKGLALGQWDEPIEENVYEEVV